MRTWGLSQSFLHPPGDTQASSRLEPRPVVWAEAARLTQAPLQVEGPRAQRKSVNLSCAELSSSPFLRFMTKAHLLEPLP